MGTSLNHGLRGALLLALAAPTWSHIAHADDSTRVQTQPQTLDAQTYAVRLADLEKRVEELKAQVRRPRRHTPMIVTPVTVYPLTSSAYVLQHVTVRIGADTVFDADTDGPIRFEWMERSAREQTVTIVATFRGSDPVFTYVSGYVLSVESERAASPGAPLAITLHEQGDATTPFAKRLTASWSR